MVSLALVSGNFRLAVLIGPDNDELVLSFHRERSPNRK
jgi:hypothetical protein